MEPHRLAVLRAPVETCYSCDCVSAAQSDAVSESDERGCCGVVLFVLVQL